MNILELVGFVTLALFGVGGILCAAGIIEVKASFDMEDE